MKNYSNFPCFHFTCIYPGWQKDFTLGPIQYKGSRSDTTAFTDTQRQIHLAVGMVETPKYVTQMGFRSNRSTNLKTALLNLLPKDLKNFHYIY